MADNNFSYSAINSARSAVSLLIPTDKKQNIGHDPLICRLIKGLSKKNPPKPRYRSIWDPAQVLKYLGSLEPIESLSLTDITLKTIGLLALVTAHRVQTLAGIKVNNISIMNTHTEIQISDRIKTSKPGNFQPTLVLPRFSDHPEWCAARSLKSYMDRVEPLRKDTDNLFLSISINHKPITSQTVSRWIKTVLANSGIDVNQFSAHSTRHAATSAAARKGISIDVIRDRAGWSNESNVFTTFYNLPLDQRSSFAISLIQ